MFPFIHLLSFGSWKQHRDVSSPIESAVSKNSLYARTTNYIEGESPHLPRDLDHSLGIAREEVPQNLSFYSVSHKYCILQFNMSHLTTLSPSSDCDKGERSAGVAEEI